MTTAPGGNAATLFLAVSEYVVDLDTVAAHVPAHRDWVLGLYERGTMLASGPRNPRVGGVLLLTASSLAEAEAIVAGDPLVLTGSATYAFTEFAPTPFPWRSPALESFLSPPR